MADGLSMKVAGLAELQAALRALPERMERQVIQRALRKAGQPVLAAAKANVPVGKNDALDNLHLRDTLVISSSLSRRQRRRLPPPGDGLTTVYIGSTRRGAHAHLVEFGTGPRTQESTGRYVGSMPRHPFLRPAWDQNKAAVVSSIKIELAKEIERAARRVARKRAKGL